MPEEKQTYRRVNRPPAATPAPAAQTTLPQTGQLNWPVPVLTVAGLLLILVGWYLRSGRQEKAYGA